MKNSLLEQNIWFILSFVSEVGILSPQKHTHIQMVILNILISLFWVCGIIKRQLEFVRDRVYSLN
jgi:hypothetical protein